MSETQYLIVLYLLISIVWFALTLIISFIYGVDFIRIILFIVITLAYIPICVWLFRRGDTGAFERIVPYTFLLLVLYLVVEAILGVVTISKL